MGSDPLQELREIHGSCLTSDLAAALEYRRGRNAADSISLSEPAILVGVDLREPNARLELAGRLPEKRRHHHCRARTKGPSETANGRLS